MRSKPPATCPLGVLKAKGYVRSDANGLEIVDLEGLRRKYLALD